MTVAFASLGVVACGGGNAASQFASAPSPDLKGQTKCAVTKSQSRPLIVEWSSTDRMELETKARQGIVAVRYVGCDMDVLERCSVPAKYKYVGATWKEEEQTIKDDDELYANLPIGAAKLEGRLHRSGALTVKMHLVGRYEAERPSVRLDELQGDCQGATHFVYAVTLGAFDFYAGGQADVGGGAGAMGIGAGGASKAERVNIMKDGDPAACEKARRDDTAPPEQCGALIRLEVVPFGEARQLTASCPSGTEWNGAECVGKKVVTQVDCPGGTRWDGSRCAAAVDTSCSAGMHFVPARGCVADVAPAHAPAPAPARGGCPSGMASLPAGTFALGDRRDTVSVHPFCMDVTEVTVSAYASCVSASGCTEPDRYMAKREGQNDARTCNWKRPGASTHPVNCVDWNQAMSYCAWANKRLPTEEEWEWAARGAEAGRTYPWGEGAPSPDRINACGTECVKWAKESFGEDWSAMYQADDGWPTTAPVGSFPRGASPQGLQDMAGNVWEWTSSIYDANNRIMRGGSWGDIDASAVRAALRPPGTMEARYGGIGFRCVR